MDFTIYLPITTTAAVLNGALLVLMTTTIGIIRNRKNLSYGDGGDNRFAKRVRAHANAVEQIPIALILLLLAEMQGASAVLLWTIAAALTVGRLCHAVQFWFQGVPFLLRPIGVVLTLLSQITALGWLLVTVVV